MAKQANRMMIGGFVVIALFILVASLAVFGSGKFLKKTNKYVLYFDESIKGLSMAAPVLFQGVPVGSVTSIVIRADLLKVKAHIPVIIEIEPDRFQVGEDKKTHRNPGNLRISSRSGPAGHAGDAEFNYRAVTDSAQFLFPARRWSGGTEEYRQRQY